MKVEGIVFTLDELRYLRSLCNYWLDSVEAHEAHDGYLKDLTAFATTAKSMCDKMLEEKEQ